MSSEVKALLQTWHRAHTVAGVAAGLCLVFLLALAPRLAAAGGPTLSAPLLVSAILMLGAGAVMLYAAARSRRAETSLALTLGADSPVLLRGQREAHGRQMWVYLAGILIAPAALLPANMPQFPIPALVVGGLLAGVALVGIWRGTQATERYWRSLTPAELAQAWSQRFTPLLVLAVTIPGYAYLRLGGAPTPFTWPPGRELVIDILATVYLNVLLVWGAAAFLQLRAWRQGAERGVQA